MSSSAEATETVGSWQTSLAVAGAAGAGAVLAAAGAGLDVDAVGMARGREDDADGIVAETLDAVTRRTVETRA